MSLEMIVLTDELISLADNFMKGIDVSEDTLMLDEIHAVGPGGHFLETTETLKHFREYWDPGLLDRSRRKQWLDAGEKTLGQRLNARVREILAEHRAEPLAAEKKAKLQEVLDQAAAEA
jgi:trimethylamine--corrinoid protein Co-methyltransferase